MEEHRNKPKPSARNQFSFQNSFYRSLRDWSVFLAPSQFETSSQKSLKENKRGRTRYKRVKVRYIVHNDDGTRTVCKPPERKPWVHRHRISIGYWATHGLGESSPYQDPDGEIENSGKGIFEIRNQNFCYIQVIVFITLFIFFTFSGQRTC